MLWNASALIGYSIEALDVSIGTINDFIFDDSDWAIHALIINTGEWFSNDKMIFPVSALSSPHLDTKCFTVGKTISQIKESLDINKYIPSIDFTEGDKDKNNIGQKHLRSIASITNNSIEATDGSIGHSMDFLCDVISWEIRYMTVDTTDWIGGKKVVISPLSIVSIDTVQKIILLNVTRERVENSPPYIAIETVDGEYDESFQTYYGIKFFKK